MTRREVLTREDVFDAADQIKAMGRKVTALKILSLLGGGSLTTIYKYFEEWQGSQLPEHDSAVRPETLPEELLEGLRRSWQLALERERNIEQTQREALIKQLQDAKQKASENEQTIDAMEEELKEMRSKYQKMKAKLKDLERETKDQAKKISEMKGEIKALTATNKQLLSQIG